MGLIIGIGVICGGEVGLGVLWLVLLEVVFVFDGLSVFFVNLFWLILVKLRLLIIDFKFSVLLCIVMGWSLNLWYSVISNFSLVVDKDVFRWRIRDEWVKNCGVFVIFWVSCNLNLLGLNLIIFNIMLVSVVFFIWKYVFVINYFWVIFCVCINLKGFGEYVFY